VSRQGRDEHAAKWATDFTDDTDGNFLPVKSVPSVAGCPYPLSSRSLRETIYQPKIVLLCRLKLTGFTGFYFIPIADYGHEIDSHDA
jgi:hypothetical protein